MPAGIFARSRARPGPTKNSVYPYILGHFAHPPLRKLAKVKLRVNNYKNKDSYRNAHPPLVKRHAAPSWPALHLSRESFGFSLGEPLRPENVNSPYTFNHLTDKGAPKRCALAPLFALTQATAEEALASPSAGRRGSCPPRNAYTSVRFSSGAFQARAPKLRLVLR
jgi:hypothetical protein